MPSITINSKGTTIKLTRAEVRAMQTTVATLAAIYKHHPDAPVLEDADLAEQYLRKVLTFMGERVTTHGCEAGT